MPRFPRFLFVLPLLLGASGNGCKGCHKQPDVDENAIIDGNDGVQDVATTLQIVSMEPARKPADTAFKGQVFGAGFASGAKATLGGRDVPTQVLDANRLSLSVPALALGSYDLTVSNPDGTSSTLRRALIVTGPEANTETCRKTVVYFETDADGLSDATKQTIDGQLPCLKARTGRVRVEGHADERGTTDYNLGLGQRRAHTVSRQLSAGGVVGSRLEVRSYGEERPAATGSNERTWSENRRVEILAE